MKLNPKKLNTLRLLCDTLVPDVGEGPPFFRRKASDIGVDKALAQVIERSLQPENARSMAQLLGILENPLLGLMLSRKPKSFSTMNLEERTELLASWRDSPILMKRTAFQALKRLTCFLAYSLQQDSVPNPNWADIGYPGPPGDGRVPHPSELTVTPTIPESGSKIETDVCIVGAGAGGSVIAYELSKAGFKVVVLEQGGYETSSTFVQGEMTMMNKLFQQQGTASTRDLSFTLLAGRGAGGGTVVNWNTCLRPPQPVLNEWQKEYGVDELLTPHFEDMVNEVWRTLRINTDESQRNQNNQVVWDGCVKLGYREGTDFEVISRNAVGCEQRCDFCNSGCIYACKQSTIMNYIPMAYKNSARFIFNARADSIVVEADRAKGVAATCSAPGGGGRFEVRARAVVVACGSMESPALLLRSGVRENGVGKYLRLHPTTAVSGIYGRPIEAWKGPPQTVAVRKYIDMDGKYHGFWIECAPAHPGLFAFTIPWIDGKSHKEFMKSYYTKTASPIVLVREWSGGRVTVDRHGLPVVSYELDSRDVETMLKGMEETARILVASGAIGLWSTHNDPATVGDGTRQLTESDFDRFCQELRGRGIHKNRVMLFSAHIMGSIRMSADPSQGPTKPTGELHEISNIYVGDASVFPTCPGVNPTVSIMAMAKRTAEHLMKALYRI